MSAKAQKFEIFEKKALSGSVDERTSKFRLTNALKKLVSLNIEH